VQFVCTGIVTEVLARTYFEAGASRTYLVRETVGSLGGIAGAGTGAAAAAEAEAGRHPRAGGAGRA
jgi:hypothetical protein